MPEPHSTTDVMPETWETRFDLYGKINPDDVADDDIIEFVRDDDNEPHGITGFRIMLGSADGITTMDRAEEMATKMALMWTRWMTVLAGDVLEFRQTDPTQKADLSGRPARAQDTARGTKDLRKSLSRELLRMLADRKLSSLLLFAGEAKRARADGNIRGFITKIWLAVGEGRTARMLDEETIETIRCLQHMLVHSSEPGQASLELQDRATSGKMTREVCERLQDGLLERLETDSAGALNPESLRNQGIMRDYGDSAIRQIIRFVRRGTSSQNSTDDGMAGQAAMHALGEKEMAKYPFRTDAGQYLRDKKFTLEKFGTDPDLADIMRKSFERVKTGVGGGIYRLGDLSDEGALPTEVFSFLLGIIMLKLCGNQSMVRRFALGEARRAEKYLEGDLAGTDDPRQRLATRILYELFSVQVRKEDNYYYVISVSDYIRYSVHFHEREWKLVNRQVWDGGVHITPHETVRLIRSELVRHIATKITEGKTPEMIPGFEGYVKRLVEISRQFVVPTVDTGEYPPCIKHAIDVLEKGENLPHSGRVMLGTFLLARGQSVKQIAPLFKNAPDYKEKTTTYQLNHLAGGSGGGSSGTQYACPGCDWIRIRDLCFATHECDNIIHPREFGKR